MTDAEKSKVWEGDLFERAACADMLYNNLSQDYQQKLARSRSSPPVIQDQRGKVLAVNAEWGFGKTFFIDRWSTQVEEQCHPVIRFNAWESDYSSEPLIGFIAEINRQLQKWVTHVPAARVAEPAIKKFLKEAKQAALPLLLEAALKITTGLSLRAIAELSASNDQADEDPAKAKPVDLDKSIAGIVERALKSHTDKQTAITSFRRKLLDLVEGIEKATTGQMPIFIFIDELDRCRPSYAIELLEGIKHLFGVRGVYFVIGVNLTQLGKATQALYGANFDGGTYLKRFFDIDYRIPSPSFDQFAKHLFDSETLNLAVFASNQFPEGFQPTNSNNLSDPILLFAMYAEHFGLSLRAQQQVAIVLQAICQSPALADYKIYPHYLFPLLMIRHLDAEAFERLATGFETVEGIFKRFERDAKPFFQVTEWQDNKTRGKKVRVVELVNVFHEVRQVPVRELAQTLRQNSNEPTYPVVLMWTMNADERKGSTERLPSISLYPDLIRQAGQLRL